MKKILTILFTFVTFLCLANNVDALRCTYYCEKCDDNRDDVEFNITTFESIRVSSSGTFKFGDETKTKSDVWYNNPPTNAIVIGGRNIDLYKITNENGYIEKSELLAEDECTSYMYYVVDSDGDRNKFYLSNLDYTSLSDLSDDFSQIKGMSGKEILTLTSIGDYTGKVSNKSLDEMVCTYSYTTDLKGYGHDGSYTETYSFKIKSGLGSKTSGSYEVYQNGEKLYTGQYSNKEIDETKKFASGRTYLDYFSIRIFWNDERDELECPPAITTQYTGTGTVFDSTEVIEIGYKIDEMNAASELYKEHWYEFYNKYDTRYVLDKTQSYIKTTDVDLTSKICTYTKPEYVCDPSKEGANCAPDLALSLAETSVGYISQFTNKAPHRSPKINITSGIISDDCDNLPKIYTNCLSSSYRIGNNIDKQCVISETPFEGDDVIELVPSQWSNSQSIDDVIEGLGEYIGIEYKKNVCELKTHLLNYAKYNDLSKTSNMSFYTYDSKLEGEYNITSLPCSSWNTEYECTTQDCKDNAEYYINKKIRDTYSYCQNVNSRYYSANNSNETLDNGRYKECKSFETFYNSLVENGIIRNIFEGCELISDELSDKLVGILNILKIAGPILAVILGMLDFTKVLVSGDADKEMKQAGKRFKNRLIAAVLLFIVPVLLSVVINIFIGDEINNNPYCGFLDSKTDVDTQSSNKKPNIIYDSSECTGIYINSTKTCVMYDITE